MRKEQAQLGVRVRYNCPCRDPKCSFTGFIGTIEHVYDSYGDDGRCAVVKWTEGNSAALDYFTNKPVRLALLELIEEEKIIDKNNKCTECGLSAPHAKENNFICSSCKVIKELS